MFSVKDCESRNNQSIRCCGARLGHPMDPVVSVQNKSFSGNAEELAKVLGADEETKSQFTLRVPSNLASPVKNYPGIILRRHHTDRKRERAVCREKEGTSAVLLQSGLDEKWWADSMECYTCLRNVTDLLSDGKTPYERRFGQPFKGPIIPFGSLVEYHPVTLKDQSRIHQFGKKVLPGLFLGYALYAVGIWKGDTMVADIEELEQMDASEIHTQRLNANEVLTPKSGEEFTFPIADGTVKLSGGD